MAGYDRAILHIDMLAALNFLVLSLVHKMAGFVVEIESLQIRGHIIHDG
jgi:hypothetical protein